MRRRVSRGGFNKQKIIKICRDVCRRQYGFFWLILIGISFFYIGLAWGKKQVTPEGSPIEALTSFVEELSNPSDLLKNTRKNKPDKVDFDIFWKVWSKINKQHINNGDLNAQDMVYGAVDGMVKAIGDPYTSYMDPSEAKEFATGMEGSFEGIGAELGMRDNILTVIAPINGMPAEKAGLKAGDKIIKINEDITSDITIDEAVKKIRGPKGTEISLTVISAEVAETREIKIIRATIDLQSVRYEQKWGNIAYIQIASFTEDAADEFNTEITKVIADNNKGIVLDLRNNPGGFLNVSVEIASRFVSRGSVVVQERHRNGTVDNFKSIGGNVFSEIPTVVLVNEGSASASEILAGALRDINGS
ncbi:MAG: S41 family peptidase, partial [Candidatus Moranbacteria bacterium]|nr:S41 family peptidase [Candidatus Moranbacteria bacterium]